jgi:hypothetical protein
MQKKQFKAPRVTKPKPDDGPTAKRMREATKPVAKKKAKTRTLDDVIELLGKHGIRFNDEE